MIILEVDLDLLTLIEMIVLVNNLEVMITLIFTNLTITQIPIIMEITINQFNKIKIFMILLNNILVNNQVKIQQKINYHHLFHQIEDLVKVQEFLQMGVEIME